MAIYEVLDYLSDPLETKEQMNPEIKVFSRKKTHASRQRSKYSFFATILNFSLSKRIELRTCLV